MSADGWFSFFELNKFVHKKDDEQTEDYVQVLFTVVFVCQVYHPSV